jgi:hypothetical protein
VQAVVVEDRGEVRLDWSVLTTASSLALI